MANYVLSNNNRYYVALESAYGVAPALTASNRVPGVRLAIRRRRRRRRAATRRARERMSAWRGCR